MLPSLPFLIFHSRLFSPYPYTVTKYRIRLTTTSPNSRYLLTSLSFSLSPLHFLPSSLFFSSFLRLNSKCCYPTMRWRSITHLTLTISYGRTLASLKAKYVRTSSLVSCLSLTQSLRLSVYLMWSSQTISQSDMEQSHTPYIAFSYFPYCLHRICYRNRIKVTQPTLHHTILHHTILHHAASHCTTSHCTTLLLHGALICISYS